MDRLGYNARGMFAALVAFFVGVTVLGLVLSKAFVKVPREFQFVVETMGKFDRVLEPGVHMVVPFLSRIRAKVPTLDQLLEVPAATAALDDGSRVTVEGRVRYLVKDAARAYTEVRDYKAALGTMTASEWQRALAGAKASGALAAAQGAETAIRDAASAWGIEVLNAVPLLSLDDALPDPPTAPSAPAPTQTAQPPEPLPAPPGEP